MGSGTIGVGDFKQGHCSFENNLPTKIIQKSCGQTLTTNDGLHDGLHKLCIEKARGYNCTHTRLVYAINWPVSVQMYRRNSTAVSDKVYTQACYQNIGVTAVLRIVIHPYNIWLEVLLVVPFH